MISTAIGTIDGEPNIAAFEDYLVGRGLSPHTVRAFVSDVEQFLTYTGQRRPNQADIEPWFAFMHARGLTNKSLARKRTSLSVLLKWAKISLELPSIRPEATLPVVLTEIEAKAVLETATHTRNGNRDRLMIEILLRTGLRESELLGLVPESLEDGESALFLRVQGKGAKERRVPVVSKSLSQSLRRYVKTVPPGELLFGMTDRNLRKLVAGIGKKAGLSKPLHPHTLRHTAATLSLRKGANLETVRRVLGHSSLATTQRYLQLTDDDVAEDMRKAGW